MRKSTLDPLVHRSAAGWALAALRRNLALHEQSQDHRPRRTALSYLDIGSAYLAVATEKALDWFRRGQGLPTSVRSYDALLTRALARWGGGKRARIRPGSRKSLASITSRRDRGNGVRRAGNFDWRRWLERALKERSAGLIYLHVDPGYTPLRQDPRFAALVAQIGLK
jgi:hypothetical protein